MILYMCHQNVHWKDSMSGWNVLLMDRKYDYTPIQKEEGILVNVCPSFKTLWIFRAVQYLSFKKSSVCQRLQTTCQLHCKCSMVFGSLIQTVHTCVTLYVWFSKPRSFRTVWYSLSKSIFVFDILPETQYIVKNIISYSLNRNILKLNKTYSKLYKTLQTFTKTLSLILLRMLWII